MTPTNEQRFVKSDPKSPDLPAPHIYWKRSALGLVCKTLFSVTSSLLLTFPQAITVHMPQRLPMCRLSTLSNYLNQAST